MTDFFFSTLVDKRVRDHLHGAGMQILTKQCEDEHDKEILYGPVSLAHKKNLYGPVSLAHKRISANPSA